MSDYVVDMSRAKSVAEALETIKRFAARKSPGDWIVGSAWHPPSQLTEKRYLTRQEIDSVAPNNPVYLRTVGHFSMANTIALEKAGVTKDTPDPSGGSFERDSAGQLTGVLVETAIDKVENAVPEWTAEDQFRQFKLAEGVLNSYGITSAVEGATPARDIAALQRLVQSGEATLRVGVMFRPEPPAENSAWEAIMRGNGASSGFGDDWLRFAGIKILYDGGMTLD
jgi:predicted amidohydrolase YtcJ